MADETAHRRNTRRIQILNIDKKHEIPYNIGITTHIMATAPKENPSSNPREILTVIQERVAEAEMTSTAMIKLEQRIKDTEALPENIEEIKKEVAEAQMAGTFSLMASTAEWNTKYPNQVAGITKAAVDLKMLG